MDKCIRPGCKLAGDSFGDCGGIHGCPRPQPVDPKKDAVISCTKCNKTWAIPINDIVQGKKAPIGRNCPQAECAAVIVNMKPSRKKGDDDSTD